MIRFEEYRGLDALALASAIKNGELSAEEVLDCAIQRAESVNPKVNAIIQKLYDFGLQTIRSEEYKQGPLFGVPFLLKDLLSDIKGGYTSSGSATGELIQCTSTATMVDRFQKLGLVVFGKTNTPEFGLLATTEPTAFGATRNPWNLEHSPGGSSGGSAAAVAAGIVPVASAGDGGGSIRIPSSCCGLFGFKPSRGLNPMGPLAESWSGAVSEHVVTRSVRDSIAVLKGTMGSDYASHVAHKIPSDFLGGANVPIDRPLKIAYSIDNFYEGMVNPDAKQAVLDTVKLLSDLGHHVEESNPPIDGELLLRCYSDIYLAHVNAQVSVLISEFGYSKVKKLLEPLTLMIHQIGQGFTAGDYMNSQKNWISFNAVMNQFHQNYDLWVSPVMAMPIFPLGEMISKKWEVVAMQVSNNLHTSKILNPKMFYAISRPFLQKAPFTQLANLTGQPAMSVPLYWNKNGLPIGVQFVADRLNDELLFRVATQLESAQPWFARTPDIN